MTKYSDKLLCFSPPVMLATFIVETILAIYTLARYKMTVVTRLVAAIIAFLAVFQLAEFNVCGRVGLAAEAWSRVGYIAITLLPAFGMHLILTIAKRKWRLAIWFSYAASLFFAVVFGFSNSAFAGHVCAGNYAIFQLTNPVGDIYFAYYYSWLFIGICLSLFFSIRAELHIRKALIFQAFGYLSFLLPTGIVNTINPQTIDGIPSIMCGFAVIYALTLAFGLVPLTVHKRS